MDHKEQHHLKHLKEREHVKQQHKAHERENNKKFLPFHPSWLLVVGMVLIVIAVLSWTFVIW